MLATGHTGADSLTTNTIPITASVGMNICGRTQQVQTAILATSSATECTSVGDLATITALNLSNMSISALRSGDFAGLSALEELTLNGNSLSSLNADIFAGLSALQFLDLRGNNLETFNAGLFNGLAALAELLLSRNSFRAGTGLPEGVFDDVLDTLDAIPITGNRGFVIDDTVRAAHFVCSRLDADAIVAATDGVTDCLRISTTQLNIAITLVAVDATLSGLTLSVGTLDPVFDSATMTYAVSVVNSVDSVTVTPTANVGSATITVDGTTVISASASAAIPLTAGPPRDIPIVVLAADTTTTLTYTLVVTRAVPPVGEITTGTVTEDAPVETASGRLIRDGGFVAQTGTTNRVNGLGTYGIFILDADGAWTYTLTNMPADMLQSDQGSATNALAAGATATDVFTALSATDNSVTQEVTITITGADDPTYITGNTGRVTEDELVDGFNTFSLSLGLADPDNTPPRPSFRRVGSGDGTYGRFFISGRPPFNQGRYTLDNARSVTNELTAGEIVFDVFTVMSGNITGMVTITITGADDPAVVTGERTGTVTEDAESVRTTAIGTLSANDPDGSDNTFRVQSNVPSTYGAFTVTAAGGWTYTLDNTPGDVPGDATNALAEGDEETDVFTVTVSDGTPATVTITVTGANDAPTADAGDNQIVPSAAVVNLNGTGSSDPDTGDALTYRWAQVAGTPTVALDDETTATATFTAPAVTEDTVLMFQLTVTDSQVVSDTDTVAVTIQADNTAAIITGDLAGSVTEDADENTATGVLTATDPTESDIEFNEQLNTAGTYGAFALTAEGAWIYTLDNDASVTNALGVTTIVPDMVTETFQVQASDNTPAVVTITITGANDAPAAEAGDAQIVVVNAEVTLDGTGSHDPEDDSPQTYRWVQIDSREVLPNAVDTDRFTFTAFSVSGNTVLTFELTVTDQNGATDTDRVTVTVHPISGGISGIELTSDAGADGVYVTGNEIVATVMFSAAVTVDTAAGSPQLALTVGPQTRQAVYDRARSMATALVFSYTVAADDQDGDGVSIGSNALNLAGGTIQGSVSNTPTVITHSEVAAARQHRVDPDGAPTVVGVTISTGPYAVGEAIELTATFNQAVMVDTAAGTPQIPLTVGAVTRQAVYASDSSTITALVFSYTVAADDSDDDGVTVASDALELNSGTIQDLVGNDAVLAHAAIAADEANQVDAVAPTVERVTISSTTIGPYVEGEAIELTATFSEAVTVAGTPQIPLTVGTATRQAVYDSDSSTTTALAFRYTVAVGDNDDNGVAVAQNALTANSGTIRDTAGNDAVLTHVAIAEDAANRVDAVVPTVNSVTISSTTTGPYVEADTIELTAAFSEAVTVDTTGGTPQIPLTVGTATHQAVYASDSSTTTALVFIYTVAAGDNDANGVDVAQNALTANSGTIRDAADHDAVLDHVAIAANVANRVDAVTPTVNSVTISTTGPYIEGQAIELTATFSEAVTVDTTGGTPQIELTVGATPRQAVYASDSSTTTALVFSYTVVAGDNDADGVDVAPNALTANSGTIRDAAGHDAVLDHVAIDAVNANRVDTAAPTVSTATIDGRTLTLTYDEALNDTSVPASSDYTLTLDPGTALTVDNGGVAIRGQTVTLTLSTAVVSTDDVTLAYTADANPLLDLVGNQAANLTAQAVINTTDALPSFGAVAVEPQTYTVGMAVDPALQLPAASGGNEPLSYTLTPALPNGLAFNAENLQISGTPTAPTALTPYTLTATDADASDPDSDTLTFMLTVSTPVLSPALSRLSVLENAATNALVGSPRLLTPSNFPAGTQTWSITGGNPGTVFAINPTTGQLMVNAPLDFETPPTTYTLTVQLAVGPHATAETTVIITVFDVVEVNQAPIAVGSIAPLTFTIGGVESATVNVAGNFNDPDGDSLTYQASSADDDIATVSVQGSVVTITAVAVGSATIQVTATDNPSDTELSPLSATQAFTVIVNRAPIAEASATLTATAPLTEAALFASTSPTVTVTLANTEYEATLTTANFTVSDTVAGGDITLDGVDRGADGTTATLTLGFDGADLIAAGDLSVTVTAAGHTGTGDLPAGSVSITASTGVNICGRTAQVRDAIVGQSSATECTSITDLADITVLNLNGQSIASLQNGDFADLSALSTLLLNNNALEALPANIFAGLSALSTLLLNNNALEALPANIFAGLSALSTLFLNNNALEALPDNIFVGLSALSTLNLNDNVLAALPADIFAGLSALSTLNLNDNVLAALPADIFAGLSALSTLNLNDNALTALPADIFADLALATLRMFANPFTANTGLPTGIFDDVLNTLGTITTNTFGLGFVIDQTVRDAHFVCSRADAAAIVMATTGVTDCLRISAAQLNTALPLVTDATLSGLTLSGGILNPPFASGTTTYEASVLIDVDTVTVTPIATTTVATIRVDGTEVASGSPSAAIALTTDTPRDIPIIVTSADTTTMTTYTVTVTRAASTAPTATLAGTLTEANLFAATAPTVTVTLANTEYTVEGTLAQSHFSVTDTVAGTVSVSDFTRDSATVATLTLAYSGEDITTPGTLSVTLAAAGHTVADDLMTNTIAITASAGANVCGRTAQVRDEIVRRSSATECTSITDLASIDQLDLSNQNIASLQNGDFAGLSALQRLDLGANPLSSLNATIFAGLTALRFLDLDNTALDALPANIFAGLTALSTLGLNNNALAALPATIFADLTALQQLSLNNNALTALPATIFAGLDGLSTLYMSANLFTADTGLPAGIFDDVLDTLGPFATIGNVGFVIDDTVRDAHFVCSRDDADAIVTLTDDVADCLRVSSEQFDTALARLQLLLSDATLSQLTISDVTLDPVFDPATTTYTATVLNSIDSVIVMPTASQSGANGATIVITVDGNLLSGQDSSNQRIPLTAGAPANIMITVTAIDEATTQIYTVAVTRATLPGTPSITAIELTSDAGDGVYAIGDVIEATVTFSEAVTVTVTGQPRLVLNVGESTQVRQAVYDSDLSTPTALVFSYTVIAGDSDNDGVSIDRNSLFDNRATILDGEGNDIEGTIRDADTGTIERAD